MVQVVWSRRSLANLNAIRRFIGRDSPDRARLTIERIRSAAARLAQFPMRGRVVPEWPHGGYREIVVRPYRIVYQYDEDADLIRVTAVVHGSRRLPSDPDQA